MSEILFWTHSGVRYLVLLAGIITVLLAIMAGSQPISRALRGTWSAFIGLLEGRNFGKVVVKVAD